MDQHEVIERWKQHLSERLFDKPKLQIEAQLVTEMILYRIFTIVTCANGFV